MSVNGDMSLKYQVLVFRLLTQYVENDHPLPFDGLRTNIVVIDSDNKP